MKKEILRFYILLLSCLLFLNVDSFATAFEHNKDFNSSNSFLLENDTLLNLADTVILNILDCTDNVGLCLGIPVLDISSYQITTNGLPYASGIDVCDVELSHEYNYAGFYGQGDGNSGPYSLQSWEVDGTQYFGNFDSIDILVDSMNVWDTEGNWVLDPINATINGGVVGNIYSDMVIFITQISAPDILTHLTVNATELSFSSGTHHLIVTENSSGCADTVLVKVACLGETYEYESTNIGMDGLYCIDFSSLPGELASVNNICPDGNNSIADFQFINGDSCIVFTGVTLGLDTACIVSCDDMDFCDTTFLVIQVGMVVDPPSTDIYDTLNLNTSSSFCDFIIGNIDTLWNECSGASGTYVDFTINEITNCIEYESVDYGVDTACVVTVDDMGNMDTTLFIVTVEPPQFEIITDVIRLDMEVIYCPITDELGGMILDTIYSCENFQSSAVNYTFNNVSLCLEVEAENIGTDSICVVLCDEFLICDTTLYLISVVEDVTSSPVANNDSDTTSQNTIIVVNVLGNDVIPENQIMEFYVIPHIDGGIGPNNGIVLNENPDGTIEYIPNDGFCGDSDVLQYVICNTLGCDTATLNIYVECPSDEIKIYDGFSPNNDGVNDFFRVEGLENQNDYTLYVFNRWGNQVYKTEEYNNDWYGDWEGTTLIDGVYFYYLEIDGKDPQSGYIVIQR